MGMFDKPEYLTGKDGQGFVQPGDTFFLWNARLDGTSSVGGETREQVKLLVSRTRDGEQHTVYTSGTGIVPQIKRMDASDRAALPIEVRLDQVAPKRAGNNPTNVLTPASDPPPSGAMTEEAGF